MPKIDPVKLADDYLKQKIWLVRENANTTYSLQGLNFYLSAETVKLYWLYKIYPKKIRDAHLKGKFHLHNLSLFGTYCMGWDLEDLLLIGFKGVPGKITSKPAKHFSSALGQVVNFFYTLQGESAGAQALSNFDTYLAPFIYYDKLKYEQVKQIMQEFLFNMNIPTRVGFQTPFTNITLDVKIPEFMKDYKVIYDGKLQKETYAEFEEEMEMFNRAFCEVMIEGDAQGRVFTFPIPTYNIDKNFDWDSNTAELIFEMSAKFGIPYFANFINSSMKPEDVRSMCCRLRLNLKELMRRGHGFFGANPLTGSIGVVTINMPQLGYLSKNEDEFFSGLEKLMELGKESLELKRKTIEKFAEKGLYPYTKFYLKKIKERFKSYWANHFSTIGLVGMNEALLNLFDIDIAAEEGKRFTIKVLKFMRDKLLEFQKETGNIYNLEATPAESSTYRLAKIDKKRFRKIIAANEKDWKRKKAAPFYTNSTWLPVDYTEDLFFALKHQDDLQTLYTGGTVFHIFLGERIHAKEAKLLLKRVLNKFRMPYITLTPTFSICPIHGYIAGEHKKCPICKRECEVYSRIVGYLRPVKQWNPGKQEEFSKRKLYSTP